jgi:hypothetical protein
MTDSAITHSLRIRACWNAQLTLETSMRLYEFILTRACLFLFLCPPAHGQTSTKTPRCDPQKAVEDKDPIAIVELGAATSWNLSGGAATVAPNLAAEVTPIENWLELEAGVSPFYTRKSTEWDTDLLFKKPWTISRKAEFMVGVGPEWVHLKQNGKVTNSLSGEIAGDFMFWPTGKHRFGWFLEPAYDYSFAGGHQQSIGVSVGLLIGIP